MWVPIIVAPVDTQGLGCPGSPAWCSASPREHRAIEKAYLEMAGSWNNGCAADMRYTYQGRDLKHPVWDVKVGDHRYSWGDPVKGMCPKSE